MEDFCVIHNYTQRDLLLLPPFSFFSSSSSSHTHPRAEAAIYTPEQQPPPPPPPSSFSAAAPPAAAVTAAIALKFHLKHEKQKQNETHYNTNTNLLLSIMTPNILSRIIKWITYIWFHIDWFDRFYNKERKKDNITNAHHV